MRPIIFAAVVCMTVSGSAAFAQPVEEIVVTGSRVTEYDPLQTPHVTLVKRADNLIVQVTVVCDTRDESQRRNELRATLRNLVRAAAQDDAIELGLGDEVVGAFNETMLDAVIRPDAKADTSRANLIIKTGVRSQDTFDAATARIKAFVDRTPKVGRTEVLIDDDWNLTLINPSQYRPAVAKLISEDATRMSALFGTDYGVQAENLQLPVSWYQSGPLDLALFIPYKLIVRPK